MKRIKIKKRFGNLNKMKKTKGRAKLKELEDSEFRMRELELKHRDNFSQNDQNSFDVKAMFCVRKEMKVIIWMSIATF